MSDRFDQVLEDASRRVSEWPEWRKSEALKQSEQLLKSTNTPTAHADENSKQPKAAAAAGGE
jgi:hypothetical protein